jgi:ABC-type phosphate transport system auxiliary subunit
MATALSIEWIIAAAIAAAAIILLGLLVFAVQGLQRRLDVALIQIEEANNQIRALRQELHSKRAQKQPPPRRPAVRAASSEETLVIR